MIDWAKGKLSKLEKGKISGGLSEGKSIKEIAAMHGVTKRVLLDKLSEGIKVESEHTDDKATAREIALDHLVEDVNYYKSKKPKGLQKHIYNYFTNKELCR